MSATLAVHTIRALFQEDDKDILGLTLEEEIRAEPEGEGLTMSERVGIGVGSAIGGLLIFSVVAFLLFRRRAKKHRNSRYPPHEMADVDGPVGDREVAQHPSLSPDDGGTTIARSSADRNSRDGDLMDDEIEALRAQKAAIQRRIEELESGDT